MEECTNLASTLGDTSEEKSPLEASTVVVNPYHNADSEKEMDSELSGNESELSVEREKAKIEEEDEKTKSSVTEFIAKSGVDADESVETDSSEINEEMTPMVSAEPIDHDNVPNAQPIRIERQDYIGKMNFCLSIAIMICVVAIFARQGPSDDVLRFWASKELPVQVPREQVALPELVKEYRNEENNMDKELYRKHGNLTLALELVWNEIIIKFLMVILQVEDSQSSREVEWLQSNSTDRLLSSYLEHAEGFTTMAEDFSNKYPVHAVIAYYTAVKIVWLKNNGKNTLLQIQFYTWGISNITEQIVNTKPMNTNLITDITTLMREMVEFVRSTESASEDDRVKYEALCLNYIGLSYFEAGQYKVSAEENEKAIKIMDEYFGEKAETYRVYGICLNNAGVAYERMGDYYKAKKFYEDAVRAYGRAEDWLSEKEKGKEEERTKTNVQKISKLT